MSFLHRFVLYIGAYFPHRAIRSRGSTFVLRDRQANRHSIPDVPSSTVNGLLSCVCLDHRALRVGTVKDVSVEGRHEPLVRPHLVQVHSTQFLYLINQVHHQVWHNIKERQWEAHLELAKSLRDELF